MLNPAPSKSKAYPWALFGFFLLAFGLAALVLSRSCGKIYTENPPGMVRGEWIPESEMSDHFRVIGLDANKKEYFMLPMLPDPAGRDPAVYREIEKQLYWLNFRFSHGDILTKLTGTDAIYVAMPDPQFVTASRGREEEFFKEYVRERRGWTDREIKDRLKFFKIGKELIWTQDACEMICRVGVPGIEMYYGGHDNEHYRALVRGLEAAYPEIFKEHLLPEALSAEGGDLEVVWGPDRKPALLLGRNRVLDYLFTTRPDWGVNKPVSKEVLEEARRAYSEGFGNLPVIIVPERGLFEPQKSCKEIFHLDMLVSIMDHHKGPKPHAFVPVFGTQPIVDALNKEIIPSDLERKAAWEFDAAASQMAALGYEVVRLPFSDHPARSPVNFGKYRDSDTGQYVVLASKFPYHLPMGNPNTPQRRLRNAINDLSKSMEIWAETGSPEDLRALRDEIEQLWGTMDYADSLPNPYYDQRAKLIRAAGYTVKEVHCFTWGSGGIHCQLLK